MACFGRPRRTSPGLRQLEAEEAKEEEGEDEQHEGEETDEEDDEQMALGADSCFPSPCLA